MNSAIFFDNRKYISAKDASTLTGYSKDYIGQLCRGNKVDCKRIGKIWYVEENSLLNYINLPSQSYKTNFVSTQINKNITSVVSPRKSTVTPSKDNNFFSSKVEPVISKNAHTSNIYIASEWKKVHWPKYRQIIHEGLFVPELNISKKLLGLALTLLLTIGLITIKDNSSRFLETVSGLPNMTNLIKEDLKTKGLTFGDLSKTISKSPIVAYNNLSALVDFYSSGLGGGYERLSNFLQKTTYAFYNQLTLLGQNPPSYIVNSLQSVSLGEKKFVDKTAMFIVDSISNTHARIFAFISDSIGGASYANLYVKDSTKNLTASVATAVSEKLNPVDHSGVVVYDTVNNWFDRSIYSPIVNFFKKSPAIVNTVYVATKAEQTKNIPNAPKNTNVTNTTNVVERIIERPVASDITKADVEARLQELNNKIQAQFSSLSTGSGGNITNVYQEIAQSQIINSLSGTTITNPTITGGSITGTSINVSNITADNASLGTTTVTNLIVTNTSTSTFSGGIAVTGGCVSVNGVCLGIGNGSGGGSAGGTFSTTTSGVPGVLFNYSNNTNDILVIGGTSSTTGKFWYDPNTLIGYFSGNVGIGTTSPYAPLSVVGQIVASYFSATSTTATSTFSGGLSTNTLYVTGTISSSTFSNGINLLSGCFAVNGVCVGSGSFSNTVANGGTGNTSFVANTVLLGNGTGAIATTSAGTNGQVLALVGGVPTWVATTTFSGGLSYSAGNVTLNLADPNIWTALQTFNYSSSTIYSSFLTASTTNLVIGGSSFNNLLGSGLVNTSNVLTLDTTFLNNTTNSYINSSTTIPKTYTSNTFTALQTFNYSSSTNYSSFVTASTTNLVIGGQSFNNLLGTGLTNSSGALTVSNLPLTSLATLPINSIVTTNSSGNIIATGTQLTVGNIIATTSATSYFLGNVAVGTTTAAYLLDVYSSGASQLALSAGAGISQWAFRNAGGNFYLGTTTVEGTATTSVSALSILGSSGFVGIGTDNPQRTLHVVVKNSGTPSTIAMQNTDTTDNNGESLSFRSDSTGAGATAFKDAVNIQAVINTHDNATYASSLLFYTSIAGSLAERMRFSSAGNFGIGDTAPGAKLAVVGNSSIGYSSGQTAPTSGLVVNGLTGIGTTTPYYNFTVASTTGAQLSLSAGAGISQWAFRNAGGDFYLGTTTVAGTATTSISALEISGSGFGTTTIRGLNIIGQATSTSNVGYNITTGCFAISGNCIGNGSFTNTVANGGTGNTSFVANTVLLGNGTGAIATTSAGTDSQVLALVNGVPTWVATTTLSTISGTLAANQGGTGQTTYTTGDILYASGATTLTKLVATTDGLVLKLNGGVPSWQSDLTSGGGGGATAWSTSTNSMIIYPTNTSNILVLGGSATSTEGGTGNIFEVAPGKNSFFGGNVRISGNSSTTLLSAYTAYFGATATSTFSNAGVLTLAGLFDGPLQANAGVVSATTSIGLFYGGTATTTFYNGGVVYSDGTKLTQSASASNFFWDETNKRLGLGTSTPFAKLSINNIAGEPAFVIGSSTGNTFIIDSLGNARLGGTPGTTTPLGEKLEVVGNIISKGTSWTARTSAESNNWILVTYGGGQFIAVSSNGTHRVMTSPDGVSWTARNAPEANSWYSVTYGNGLYVAVAQSGTHRVMTSPDGVNWTAQNAAEQNTWWTVTYGNGLFVAVAVDGAHEIMTSPDGVTWTARTSAEANTWRAVTYGNGQFVAVGITGTHRVMTSPDGVTWTAQTASEANNWTAVTYAHGQFVAVSYDGSHRVMTSPDGVTWTAQTASEANNWNSVVYGNGLYVATSESGTNKVMTSPDGVNWTARQAAPATYWTSVAYGNGIFAAVSYSGQAMSSGKSEVNINPSLNIYQGGASFIGPVGIGTTTHLSTTTAGYNFGLTIFGAQYSSTTNFSNAPQLSLSDGVGVAQWTFRNAGGNFYLGTTTVDGTATTSISALEISGSGFGTTTVRGLTIANGQATSTSNVGWNITGGCYAIGGNCLSVFTNNLSSGGTATTTFYNGGVVFSDGYRLTQASSTSSFFWDDTNHRLGLGTSTPWGLFSINPNALGSNVPEFVIGSTSATHFVVNGAGNVGIGTSTLGSIAKLQIEFNNSESNKTLTGLLSNFTDSGSINTPTTIKGIDSSPRVTSTLSGAGGSPTLYGFYSAPVLSGSTPNSFNGVIISGLRTSPSFTGTVAANDYANISGLWSVLSDNLTGAGSKIKTGLLSAVTGTADSNYGVNITAYGANNNYGLAITSVEASSTNYAIYSSALAQSYIAASLGIGTTSPFSQFNLTLASSNQPQLALSAGAGFAQTVFRNDGTNFYISSTTVAGTATTSTSALEIALGGFGTTTIRGLNILGLATSTSNVGWNITTGCYAYNSTCIGGSSFSNTLLNGGTATTTFYNGGVVFSDGYRLTQASSTSSFFWDDTNQKLGLGTSTPWARLSINTSNTGSNIPEFAIGSSTGTHFLVDGTGQVGIGTASPTGRLHVLASGSDQSTIIADQGATTAWGIQFSKTGLSSAYALLTGNFQLGWYATMNPYVDDNANFKLGSVGARWNSISIGTGASQFDGAVTINGNLSAQGGLTVGSLNGPLQANAGVVSATTSIGVLYGGTGATSFSPNSIITSSADGLSLIATSSQLTVGSLISTTTNNSYFLGNLGLGTTTPSYLLNPFSSTASQLALSAGAGIAQWAFRNAGGNFYLGTTTVDGTATTSVSALTIIGSSGNIGVGTSTPWGLFSINPNALGSNVPEFVIGSSSATHFIVGNGGNVGIGTTSPGAKLAITGTATSSGAGPGAIAGILQDLTLNNNTSSGTQFGNRFINTVNGSLAGSEIGTLIRIVDSTSLANTTRGLEVQAWTGTNTAGTNTGIAGFGKTFGVTGTTDGLAGGVSSPAAIFADLDNGSAPTSGNAIRAYSDNATSANLVSIYQETSAYTGTGLVMNFGNNSGSFNGKFIDLQNAGTSKFVINAVGNVGVGTSTPGFQMQLSTTSSSGGFKPQLALSDFSAGANAKHWTFASQGGNFYIATSTDAYATTSISALEISGSGFGTTTIRGLNIVGLATSTSNVGISLTGGCYAIGTTCLSLSTLGGTVPVSKGGTNVTSFALNSIITSSADGLSLIATSSQLTVGSLISTTTNNSYFLGNLGLGTTTPSYLLNPFSSSASQLSLSAGAGIAQWAFRNAGGNFYLGTTTVDGTATTSVSALSISGSGFGTTTILGLNIVGQATSTSNVGFNITTGCYAYNGICVGGGSFSNTLLNGGTATTTFYNGGVVFSDGYRLTQASSTSSFYFDAINNRLGLGTSTPSYLLNPFSSTASQLSLSAGAGVAQWAFRNAGGNFYLGTTTIAGTATTSVAALTILGTSGNVGIGIANPTALMHIQGGATIGDLFKVSSSTGNAALTIGWYGGILQNIASTTALDLQDGSGNRVFAVDTTQSSSNAGIDVTAGGSQTGNLFNLFSSGGTPLAVFMADGGFLQNISSTTAFRLQSGAGVPLFNVDTLNSKFIFGTTTSGVAMVDIISDLSVSESNNPSMGSSTASGLRVISFDSDSPTALIKNANPYPCVGQATGCTSAVAAGSAGILTVESATTTNTTWYNLITAFSGSARNGTNAVFRVRGDGNVYGEAAFNASGADYAEYFDTFDTTISTGDIVVATITDPALMTAAITDAGLSTTTQASDISAVNEEASSTVNSLSAKSKLVSAIMKSNKAYDNKILGIISNQAAFIGNNPSGRNDSNKFKKIVGLVGRVPVKVSLENGAIAVGDYLTTSAEHPGYAMKATRSGYVLGVALEPSDVDSPETCQPGRLTCSEQSNTITTVLTFIQTGYKVINNTFVLGEDDGQLASATTTESGSGAQISATTFLINQKGSGNILQLQQNGTDRLLIKNDGTLAITSQYLKADNKPVLSVLANDGEVLSVTSAGDISIKGIILASKNTAGSATIKAGTVSTKVIFDKPYSSAPKVVLTPQGLPDSNYGVTEKTGDGFTITMKTPTTEDITFDWMALYQPDETAWQSLAFAGGINLPQGSPLGNGGGGNATTTDITSPEITIIGNNPATIEIGATYSDMGATVADRDETGAVNNNLGLHFNVDGADASEVSIDTTVSTSSPQATTTHTIVYSAVDGAGNWSFATRTVEVIPQQ